MNKEPWADEEVFIAVFVAYMCFGLSLPIIMIALFG